MKLYLLKTMLLLCALVVESLNGWAETKVLTFYVSSNPGNWPTTNSTTLTNYSYTLDGVDYTFALKNVKCNTGYLMLTSTAVLGLPAIEGYKLTKVVASNTSNCSTSTKVGISSSSSSASYISGGEIQTWSKTASEYTYNLTSTEGNTVYYMYVTNKNAQILDLKLTYESTTSLNYSVTYDGNGATSGSVPTDVTEYDENNNTVTVLGNTGNLTKTGYTFDGWNTKADGSGNSYDADDTFTISANTTLYAQWEANTYNVTLPAEDEYGTYTMNASNPVAYNTNVKLTFTPKTGYADYVATWSVNGDAISGNSFTMPDEAVTVTVSLEAVTEFTWDLSTDSYDSVSEDLITWSSSYATMKNEKGSSDTNVNNYIPTGKSSTRMYTGNKLTITPAKGYKINMVEFTATSESYASALKNSTWSNANASVEASTVTVTPINGAIAFYATIGGTCGFTSVKVRYEEDTTPLISVNPTSINATFNETEGTIDITYVNITDNSTATVYFCNAQGSATSYDWLTAQINSDNNIAYLISANSGDERTAYMKVKVGDIYSDLITIKQAKYEQVSTYTLASNITSGKHYVIAATTATRTMAMGGKNASKNYYDAFEASLNENTITVPDDSDIQEFVIYGPNADGYYSIYDPVAGGYLYASSGSSNDLSYQTTNNANGLWEISFTEGTATAKGTNSRNILSYNSSNPRFSCYQSKQTAIKFYEKDGEATPTESKTLNGSGYATYCSQNALDFTGNSEVTAWAITGVSGETITFSQITGKVPAGTGMLLKGAANASVTMTSATGATALSGNLLVGTLTSLDVTANQYYGLSGNTFVKVNAGTVPAGKALLPASVVNGDGARLTFVFEEATGISTVESVKTMAEGYYNIQGQRVDTPKKGLYIVNGKKVIIK